MTNSFVEWGTIMQKNASLSKILELTLPIKLYNKREITSYY